MIVTEEIPAALAGERLDRIVSLVGDLSRSQARELVEAGGVTVDGEPAASGKVRLVEGQTVTVDLSMVRGDELPGPDATVEFRIVHEDPHVLVVEKPPGLVFDAPSGVIDAAIGRDPRDPLRMAVVRDGKHARTRFDVEREFDEPAPLSLVRCSLETGRTHQIRVHLAAVGHPVVGDTTYGGVRPALRAPRPMLHAETLAFVHPVTGESLSFRADIPADMAAVIAACA